MKLSPLRLALFLVLAGLPALGADGPTPAPAPLEAYAAVGASLVQDNRLAQLGWTEAQIEAFISGVRAGFRGEGRPVDAAAQGLLAEIGRRMQELEEAERQRQFGTAAFARPGYLAQYLKEIRRQFSLDASDTGLCYGIRSAGYGARPTPEDTIIISYKVTKADARTDLPELGVNRLKVRTDALIAGLAEGFQMMTVGSTAMLVVPPELSYGDGEWPPGADRGTPLIYTVQLHEIEASP